MCVCLGALVPVAAAVIVEDSEEVLQRDSFSLPLECYCLLVCHLLYNCLPVIHIRVCCACPETLVL